MDIEYIIQTVCFGGTRSGPRQQVLQASSSWEAMQCCPITCESKEVYTRLKWLTAWLLSVLIETAQMELMAYFRHKNCAKDRKSEGALF